MFILLRKIGEHIVINDEIKCKVLDISSSTVKIGIKAPAHVRIKRGEIDKKSDSSK